jgi:hypothetical protein
MQATPPTRSFDPVGPWLAWRCYPRSQVGGFGVRTGLVFFELPPLGQGAVAVSSPVATKLPSQGQQLRGVGSTNAVQGRTDDPGGLADCLGGA